MEINEMLNYYNAPDVNLTDIVYKTNPQKRLIELLIKDGVRNTKDLRKMSDEDILNLDMFGGRKLEKLHEFIMDWYNDDFPVVNRINVARPETVMQSLQEDVFLTYKNMQIVAMREYQKYDGIGMQFGQSRQSVQDKEKYTQKKFVAWYDANRIADKIGNMDEFRVYCDKNFPEDQRVMKTAVKRLVMLTKKAEEKKNSSKK